MNRTCRICGVPEHTPVCIRIRQPGKWALDTDLADEYPEEWAPAREQEILKRGICRRCAAQGRTAA